MVVGSLVSLQMGKNLRPYRAYDGHFQILILDP